MTAQGTLHVSCLHDDVENSEKRLSKDIQEFNSRKRTIWRCRHLDGVLPFTSSIPSNVWAMRQWAVLYWSGRLAPTWESSALSPGQLFTAIRLVPYAEWSLRYWTLGIVHSHYTTACSYICMLCRWTFCCVRPGQCSCFWLDSSHARLQTFSRLVTMQSRPMAPSSLPDFHSSVERIRAVLFEHSYEGTCACGGPKGGRKAPPNLGSRVYCSRMKSIAHAWREHVLVLTVPTHFYI